MSELLETLESETLETLGKVEKEKTLLIMKNISRYVLGKENITEVLERIEKNPRDENKSQPKYFDDLILIHHYMDMIPVGQIQTKPKDLKIVLEYIEKHINAIKEKMEDNNA